MSTFAFLLLIILVFVLFCLFTGEAPGEVTFELEAGVRLFQPNGLRNLLVLNDALDLVRITKLINALHGHGELNEVTKEDWSLDERSTHQIEKNECRDSYLVPQIVAHLDVGGKGRDG